MSMVVNNNLMAANTARNLNAHYGRLATSTQRLSSGLRINSAADDAAGLAIRELQRADIAALHQGARNANDAISMIQVADGALGIIDEKLIRMKELAEQASTGTYDSTQRLMIESEYQAMASEITRIANATDFNGIKLLDGTLDGAHDGSGRTHPDGLTATGKMKIHFGTGNDSAEDYYYITIGECTSEAFGLGNASTWQDVQKRAEKAFKESLEAQIRNDATLSSAEKGEKLAQIGDDIKLLNEALTNATDYKQAADLFKKFNINLSDYWQGNSTLMDEYLAKASETPDAADVAKVDLEGITKSTIEATLKANKPELPLAHADKADFYTSITEKVEKALIAAGFDSINAKAVAGAFDGTATKLGTDGQPASATDWDTYVAAVTTAAINNLPADPTALKTDLAKAANMDAFWGSLRTTEQQKLQYAWGQAAVAQLANGALGITDFGANKGFALPQDMTDQALADMRSKVGHMDFAGHTIETQEDAQHALEAINAAIVQKDKIRAHLGATQNRLENTVSNLNIQAENLQAAESRISDVDVATEMTQFVRNQILTQSAVAMLSQANSLPQMAMQLIGG